MCKLCLGEGITIQQIKQSIDVPKGVDHKQKLRKMAQGEQNEPDQEPGDLVVEILLKPDDYFQRREYDVYSYVYLTVS